MSETRILIVEDEAIIARDIRRMLAKLGYEVVAICDTGEEAVIQAARLQPDLVLMDIRLEGAVQDGIKAAEIIRAENDIPVVFLTSYTDQATLDRAKVAGPRGFVVKPVKIIELYAAIEVAVHRAILDRQVAERERWLANVMCCIGDAIIVTDADGVIQRLNPEAARLVGRGEDDALKQPFDSIVCLTNAAGNPHARQPLVEVLQHEVVRNSEDNLHLRSEGQRLTPVEYTASALRDQRGKFLGMVIALRDVSERRAAETERERLIAELRDSLEKIKTLKGLLPICSYCKKIRNDQGYWERVESYIESHSDAQFSHGYCPDCVREHFPELADEIRFDPES